MLSYANTVGRSNPIRANYITVITFKINMLPIQYALQCFIITFSITAKPGRGDQLKGFMIEHPDCIMVFCLLTFI